MSTQRTLALCASMIVLLFLGCSGRGACCPDPCEDAAGRPAALAEAPPADPGLNALALSWDTQDLTGFDTREGKYRLFDPRSGETLESSAMAGLAVRGMAHHPAAGVHYLADAASGSLYRLRAGGAPERMGAAGALGTNVRALAYDASDVPGVLYGFDVARGAVITVDLATGVPTVAGPSVPGRVIEAMTYDPDTLAVLALDGRSGELFELDRASGALVRVADSDLKDIRGMAAVPGSADLFVVHGAKLAVIDRFTAHARRASREARLHRGAGDPVVMLLWPVGDVRRAGLATFALEVPLSFEAESQLVFRKGDVVLHREAFEPEGAVTIAALPKAVAGGLRIGETVTWGLVGSDGEALVEAEFTVVKRPAFDKQIAEFEQNLYLRKQPAATRESLVGRELEKAGLWSEALMRHVNAAALDPSLGAAQRGIATAAFGSQGKKALAWSPERVIEFLGSSEPSGRQAADVMGSSTSAAPGGVLEVAPYDLVLALQRRLAEYEVPPPATNANSVLRDGWRVALKPRARRMIARLEKVAAERYWDISGSGTDDWRASSEKLDVLLRELSGLYVDLDGARRQLAKVRVTRKKVTRFGTIATTRKTPTMKRVVVSTGWNKTQSAGSNRRGMGVGAATNFADAAKKQDLAFELLKKHWDAKNSNTPVPTAVKKGLGNAAILLDPSLKNATSAEQLAFLEKFVKQNRSDRMGRIQELMTGKSSSTQTAAPVSRMTERLYDPEVARARKAAADDKAAGLVAQYRAQLNALLDSLTEEKELVRALIEALQLTEEARLAAVVRRVDDPLTMVKGEVALSQINAKRILARQQRFTRAGRYSAMVRGDWLQLRTRILKMGK